MTDSGLELGARAGESQRIKQEEAENHGRVADASVAGEGYGD